MKFLLVPLILVACAVAGSPMAEVIAEPPAQTALEPLPFFGDGYRKVGDPCRIVGENDYTNRYLDHTEGLVGCPADMPNLDMFVETTGAVLLEEYDGTILYSVPRNS